MDTPKFSSRFSDPVRSLPGCRSSAIAWEDCRLHVSNNEDSICVTLQVKDISWTRAIKKENNLIQCNLQELEILRWILGERGEEASTRVLGLYSAVYAPQRRYSCLFPHQDLETHDVLEISPGMTEEELKEFGEQAINHRTVLLCPVPASTCRQPTHPSVSKEVCKLAEFWPVRQIQSAPAVTGMVDVSPVVICRASSSGGGCEIFQVGGAMTTCPETRIRTHRSLGGSTTAMLDLTRMLDAVCEHNARAVSRVINPETAIHDSWQADILHCTQPSVLACQYRTAEARPTRLWDARDRVLKSDIVEIENYLALSYCWGEWPEENNESLRDKLAELSIRLGVRYFWIDRWCVLQDCEVDKAREIPRMREYYMGASGCVVLLSADAKPFECVPQQDGVILSTFQQMVSNQTGLRSLLASNWASRVWTLQEALLSRQLIYAVQGQLIDGDFISELIAYLETASEEPHGPHLEETWIGGYGCYAWNAKALPVIHPRQFRIEARQSGIEEGPETLCILRTVFGGEQQYRMLQSRHQGCLMPFEEALTLVKGRSAAREEDYVYGILGISERGDEVQVEYGISWPAMMEKLRKTGKITERQLASSDVNSEPGRSWLPECGSKYGPFQNIDRLTAFVPRPELSWGQDGATITGAMFEWTESMCEKRPIHNRYGAPCFAAHGKIRFIDIPGLYATVWGTSESLFTEERMSGTHIMLCKDVKIGTKVTIAIQVTGKTTGKQVSRKDGYVLELGRWSEGNVDLLQGTQWLVS